MRHATSKMASFLSVGSLALAGLLWAPTAIAEKPLDRPADKAADKAADNAAWAVFLPKAGEVGSGQFRWWGFLVYDATLWSPLGQYQPGGPFALTLRYARTVSKEDIVKASIDQMRELGFAVDRNPEWTQKLDQAMESVKAGDTLTGVYTPGQGAVFFYNDQLTGQIDERLAKAFFAIWLDPKTKQPALRQALLGQEAIRAPEVTQ